MPSSAAVSLAGWMVTLSQEHLRVLDEVSAPTLDYPAPMRGALRAMPRSDVRY